MPTSGVAVTNKRLGPLYYQAMVLTEQHMFGTPSLLVGETFTGLLDLTDYLDDSSTMGIRIPCGAPMCIFSHLPLGKISIYDAKVQATEDINFLAITEDTWWHHAENDGSALSPTILELCAGAGGMGIGAHYLGGQVKVAVDNNDLSVDHLQINKHGEVLKLDMNMMSSAKIIHQKLNTRPGTTTLGFPCQPLSSQGLQLGAADFRFQTFFAGLRIAFLTNTQTMVLECVPAAHCNPEIQHGLQRFAQALGLDCLQVELDLQSCWPCRRHRWWAVLMPHAWNTLGLPAWPETSTFSSVGHLFKNWGVWTDPDETALMLSPYELEKFCNPQYGRDKRLLEFQDVASTLLHSYSNALGPCPCLCRASAFSEISLRLKGLRGYFVTSQVTGQPRYLHHREAALLLGLPEQLQYAHGPRSNLALLGQVASPLQMIWVYGHLLFNVHRALGLPMPAPMYWIESYQQELLRQTAHLFQSSTQGILGHVTLRDANGESLTIASATASTVSHLLHANRILLDWNEIGGITRDGLRLPLQKLLDFTTGPYALTSQQGPPERERPSGLIMIAITHQGQFHAHFLVAGSFLFEALNGLQIQGINFLTDQSGRVFGADFRVWKTMNLHTLPNWPPQFAPGLYGSGPGPHHLGLHDGHIWLALQSMCNNLLPDEIPLLVHPRTAYALLHGTWDDGCLQLAELYKQQPGRICCIFAANQHWALLWGEKNANEIYWHYCDGIPGFSLCQAGELAGRLNNLLNIQEWEIEPFHQISQTHPHTCGAIAILHAGLCLGLFGAPSDDAVLQLHSWLLNTPSIGIIHATGPNEISTRLTAMLVDHGVPAANAPERASQVLQKLGASAVKEAFDARNSWAYLKALASRPSIGLRLVHADELSKHVENTAKVKFGAAVTNHKLKKKSEKKTLTTPLVVDPTLLVISGFQDSEGDEVPQIEFAALGAEAHGVAICSLAQGIQWLKTSGSISTNPLALLVTEAPPEEILAQHEVTPMTFTAKYTGTGEPIILYGAIKQLGDQVVNRVIPKAPARPDIIETQVLKIVVYRDEFEVNWPRFSEAPLRFICQAVPALTLCHGNDCGADCPKSHSPVDENYDTIMSEVWSRTFAKLEGGKSSPDDAQMFWVYVRVPKGIIGKILDFIVPGIYFEPRSDTKGHDEDYRVIWIQSRNLEEAIHACKSNPHSTGLVRLKRKYGVRVRADDEEAAFKALRPDSVYIDTQVQRVFQLCPLPHGLQRAGVIKLLAGLKWNAKPLQPGKSTTQSMTWMVGSSSPPPSQVFTAFDQEVIVTEMTKENKVKPPPRYIASSKTQKHMRNEAASSTNAATGSDPWWTATTGPNVDPWKDWKGSQPAAKPAPGRQHLQEVTEKLRDELNSSLEKQISTLKSEGASSSSDAKIESIVKDTDKRFHKLETKMTEMQAQNQQFSQWFGTMGQQLQSTESSIQTIQYTLSTHQQELTGLHHEVKAVPDHMAKTLQSALNTHKAETSSEMDDRFNRLEALLAKKQRSEWLSGVRASKGSKKLSNTHSLIHPLKAFIQVFLIFGCFLHQASALALPLAELYVPSTASVSADDCDFRSEDSKLSGQSMPIALNLFLEQNPDSFLNGVRFGEAEHPGPSSLTVGCTNPSGLRTKEHLAIQHGPGIWSFSETQLSAFTQRSSTRALKSIARSQGRSLRTYHGAPAPLRTRSEWAGKHTGVCCISDLRSRHLELSWPADIWASGRVLATQHYYAQTTITMVSIYGLPRGPTWPKARQQMNDILEFLTKNFIYGHQGHVIILGDFNFGPTELEQFHLWRNAGWISAQEFAALQWQAEWHPTCKGATERDLIWMSPSIQSICTDVQVEDIFSEHSSVSIQLSLSDDAQTVLAWPRPQGIPWDQVDLEAWTRDCEHKTFDAPAESDQFFSAFADHYERSLTGFVQAPGSRLLPSQCGRATRMSPEKRDLTPATAKASRPGEVTLQHDLVGTAVLRWFRQLRRIQSLVHALRGNKQCPTAVGYRCSLWKAILTSNGFEFGFTHWWAKEGFDTLIGPLPDHPPDLETATWIFAAFHAAFRQFENWHQARRQHIIDSKYDKNFQAIFRDLREPCPEQIDTLWDSIGLEVCAIRPNTKAALFDRPVPEIPGSHNGFTMAVALK